MGKYKLEVEFNPEATRANLVEMLRMTADNVEAKGSPEDLLNSMGTSSDYYEIDGNNFIENHSRELH
jgi:hypothetical protein